MTTPAISICIPAYRQPRLLQRCLESIQQQHFKDVEVVITDDSPDDSVEQVAAAFRGVFPLIYQHHAVALGSPENWNAGLKLATGRYVKIMHQDDWLAHPDSLNKYYAALENAPGAQFVFSACTNVDEEGARTPHAATTAQLALLEREPECLLLGNFIGAPSTGMFRREPVMEYDGKMKWLVDIDQYIRLIYYKRKVAYIPEPLVNIGIHGAQVTQAVQHDATVVVREHLLLLSKLEKPVLRRLPYFDWCWRLLRNHGVRSVTMLESLAGGLPVPKPLRVMTSFQARIPPGMLQNGPVSKSMMLLAYCCSRITG